ncbi:MAG: glycosyl hydrolase [Acholeplasmataceae bacterium]|nr:glycosyl hydrolase [Acholeplasmataceae bacterium]
MDINKIVKKMTLEEKVSLMSGKNFWETQEITKHQIPSMFLADGPHGVRKQAAAADHLGLNESLKATCFPPAVSLANTWNKELVTKIGTTLGEEAKAHRVNILLGPGTNIKRNPLCGRNFEYYSEDPYLAGQIAAAQIVGIQKNDVSACVKHYAVNNQEERRMVIDSVVDQRALREIYLTPFEMAVKQGEVKTVMSAYNKVNGVFANENEFLLKTILREQWGFNGIIVTDWGGNNDRVLALKAGNDLEMPGNAGETDLEILKAVQSGEIEEEILDEAVKRLLEVTLKTNSNITGSPDSFSVEKNHQVAYQAATEAIVLLKNDNVLPLKKGKKVAIVGDFAANPRYQGAGSSIVNPTKLESTLDVIAEYEFDFIGYAKGFKRYGKKSKNLISKAKKLSAKAEVILLYLGLDEITEVEGLDRPNMKLPENQLFLLEELSKLNVPLVVVLSTGSQIELPFIDKISALVHGHLLGQAGAKALLDVIVGKVNPSGKLSETIPIKYEDVSTAKYFPGKEKTVEYRESIYVGYRYFEKNQIGVRYPFGFGLSYTNFLYSDLTITSQGVSFKLTNAGKVEGKEVVQFYVGMKDSKIFRPVKELKGFAKINLKPEQTKQVNIAFDDYTFRFWNQETGKYEVETGKYQIYINSSLNKNELLDEIEVMGTLEKIVSLQTVLPNYYSGKINNVSDEEFEKILGYPIPNPHRKYVKRNRIVVGYNTTVAELRYAKGWTGRFFAWAMRVAPKLLKVIGKKQLANTIYMGMYHQPMRGISRMTNGMISWSQLEGLLIMFNGKFFKGLTKFRKEARIKRKKNKMKKKEAKISG